jgi:GNAT superfamily N-acetyltransferase
MLEDRSNLFKIEWIGVGGSRCFHAYDAKNRTHLGKVIVDAENIEFDRYKCLCNGNKLAKIVRVETDREYCGWGVATELLKEVIRTYKDYNLYLLCHPMPRGHYDESHKTVKDLKRFYGKLGFVPCGELLPTMIRKASLPTLGE